MHPGGIASLCLCNMVLDGLEGGVKTAVKSGRQINFIRYADDFIVTARHRSDLENTILPAIKTYLRVRGLNLSEAETRIRHIREGFDFLGHNLRKNSRGKLWTTPSRKNVNAFLTKTRETTRRYRGHNPGTLTRQLNPKLPRRHNGCQRSRSLTSKGRTAPRRTGRPKGPFPTRSTYPFRP